MSSDDEVVKIFTEHFLNRFNTAVARVTGNPMDELFMSPGKAFMLLREWLNSELQSAELQDSLIAALPDDKLYELRSQYKQSLRRVMDEIENRRHG